MAMCTSTLLPWTATVQQSNREKEVSFNKVISTKLFQESHFSKHLTKQWRCHHHRLQMKNRHKEDGEIFTLENISDDYILVPNQAAINLAKHTVKSLHPFNVS